MHGVIAHTIESKFSDMADSQPEIVARHFTEAELIERAVHYWLKAGQLALGRSAKTAVSHLEQGLRLVASIENAPLRKKSELLLRISLGNSLRTTQGWSSDSVGREYTRALQLCSESGLDEHTLPAVFGLWTWNFLHPALRDAQALAEQLLNTAEKSNEPTHKVLAHEALGFTLFAQGRFCAAHSQLERSTSICGETEAAACLELSAQEPRVHAKLYDGMTLWFLGYPDQGLRACAEACLYADASEHPFSQAMARTISLRVHQLRGEAAIVASQADAAIALCEEHEFAHYLAMSSILRGWAMAQQGKFEKGVAEIQQGLEKQRAIGALLYDSYSLGLLADACISNGHCEQAMEPLRQAESRLQDEGSARFYAAEIYRLLGEAHLRAGHNADIAECYFNCGLDIAREQNARSLELKLCESLCRLYDLGRSSNRYKPLLENVYRSFTEGFETADLVNAKAALHAANFA
jgi:predicted ATPase